MHEFFLCFVLFFGNLGISLFFIPDLCDTCDLKQIMLTWVEVRDRYVFLFGWGCTSTDVYVCMYCLCFIYMYLRF